MTIDPAPQKLRRRFQLSPFLLLLVRLLFVLVVLFGLLRAGLIARNWLPGMASAGEIARAFLVGMRFDLAIACYLCVPLIVAAYLPWTSPAIWHWTGSSPINYRPLRSR